MIPTRASALARWQEFLPRATQYTWERNYVREGHESVTRLSAAVRVRLVSEHELAQQALEQFGFEVVEKIVQEIYWRLYWKGWLEHRSSVWTNAQNLPELTERQDELRHKVESGESQVEVMNHWAKELVETGYLHNHVRMWFASYWVHRCGLPWQWGARFFYDHLLDADPASNTLSWRWVAGLQTVGKTYMVRRSNIEKYTEPAWLEDRQAGLELLESEGKVEIPAETPVAAGSLKPLPSLDQVSVLSSGAWLLHEDDLSLETVLKHGTSPKVVLALNAAHRHASARQKRYRAEALQDGLNRLSEFWQVPGVWLDQPEEVAERLKEWPDVNELHYVEPWIGPAKDMLEDAVAHVKLPTMAYRRNEDIKILPLAKKGFFPFWAELKKRLN
ncbi:MAG: FAD-binding domain-containing protein [Verrucomicrobiales bacterium]